MLIVFDLIDLCISSVCGLLLNVILMIDSVMLSSMMVVIVLMWCEWMNLMID